LLEVMSADVYPAVRHLAWRAFTRLGVGDAGAYDPSADVSARAAVVERLRARLGAGTRAGEPISATWPISPTSLASLRARARQDDVEIGE
jgi:hypothetical protein